MNINHPHIDFCVVPGCSNPDTHVTDGHQCNSCKSFGHSARECITGCIARPIHFSRVIPSQFRCSIPGCKHSKTHTTNGHLCTVCRKFGHSGARCRNNTGGQMVGIPLHRHRHQQHQHQQQFVHLHHLQMAHPNVVPLQINWQPNANELNGGNNAKPFIANPPQRNRFAAYEN